MTADETTAARRVMDLMDELAMHQRALGLLRAEEALTRRLLLDTAAKLAAATDHLSVIGSRPEPLQSARVH